MDRSRRRTLLARDTAGSSAQSRPRLRARPFGVGDYLAAIFFELVPLSLGAWPKRRPPCAPSPLLSSTTPAHRVLQVWQQPCSSRALEVISHQSRPVRRTSQPWRWVVCLASIRPCALVCPLWARRAAPFVVSRGFSVFRFGRLVPFTPRLVMASSSGNR